MILQWGRISKLRAATRRVETCGERNDLQYADLGQENRNTSPCKREIGMADCCF